MEVNQEFSHENDKLYADIQQYQSSYELKQSYINRSLSEEFHSTKCNKKSKKSKKKVKYKSISDESLNKSSQYESDDMYAKIDEKKARVCI